MSQSSKSSESVTPARRRSSSHAAGVGIALETLEQRQLLSAAVLGAAESGRLDPTAVVLAAAFPPTPAGSPNILAGSNLTFTATALNTASPNNTSVYGQAVTLTATVTGTGSTAPTGTVFFMEGPVVIGSGALTAVGALNSTATLVISALHAGTHSIMAIYGSDSENAQSLSSGLSQTVTPKPIQLTGVTVANKVYDGTTAATLDLSNATLVGILLADSQHVGIDVDAVAGAFASKNAGSAVAVTLNNAALGGSAAGDYALQLPTLSADITAKPLSVTGITAANKVYDRTLAAKLKVKRPALTGVVAGEEAIVTLAARRVAGTFSSWNVGTHLTVTVSGFSLKGPGAANYLLPAPTVTATITPKLLVVSGIKPATKVYDGSTTIVPDASAATLLNVLKLDTNGVSIDATNISGTLASAGVQKNIPMAVGGLSLVGIAAGNYLFTVKKTAGTVTARALTVTGITASDKVYDGTATATLDTSAAALAGVVSSDINDLSLLTANAAGSFESKNAGSGVTVRVSGLTLDGVAAHNYTLVQPTTTANITARSLTVAGLTAADKIYDALGATAVSAAGGKLSGVLAADRGAVKLTAAGATGNFVSTNAGANIVVTVNGLTLTGKSAANYAIAQATAMADILPRGLIVSGITTSDKEYDGSADASIDTSSISLSGILEPDLAGVELDASGATGSFASKAAGTGKVVTVNGMTLSGNLAGNYVVIPPTMPANITPRAISISGFVAANKTYDGSTVAVVDASQINVSGIVFGDYITVTIDHITGTFSGKDAGEGLAVTVVGVSFDGADSGNYTLDPLTAEADITPKAIVITGITAGDKVFNGTPSTTIDVSHAVMNGILLADASHVALDTTNAFGTFATSYVGTGLTVTAGGLVLTGSAAGNYAIAAATAVADITGVMSVSVAGIVVQNKTYDGTANAVADFSNAYLTNVPEEIAHSVDFTNAVATFNSIGAGTGVAVTISGIVLTGEVAPMYTLVPPTVTADIIPIALTVSGITVNHKSFDYTLYAPLDVSGAVLSDVLPEDVGHVFLDTASAHGRYDSPLGNNYYSVNILGLALTGDAASNYSVSAPQGAGLLTGIP